MKYLTYIIYFALLLGIIDIIRDKPLKKYKIYGENNRDTIVFIHGLNDDNTGWYKQIPFFSKYYKCIVVNRTSDAKYLDYEDIYHIIQNNKSSGNLYFAILSFSKKLVISFSSRLVPSLTTTTTPTFSPSSSSS